MKQKTPHFPVMCPETWGRHEGVGVGDGWCRTGSHGLKLLLSRRRSRLLMLQKSNCSFPLFEFTPKFSFSYQNVFHFLSCVKTNDVLFRELISFPSLLVGTAQAGESSQSVCVCVWGGCWQRESNPPPLPGRTGARWLGWASYSHPLQTCPESQLHSGQRLQPPEGKENVGKITQSSKMSQIVFKKICHLKTPNSVLPWRFGKSRAEWLQQQEESGFGSGGGWRALVAASGVHERGRKGREETHNGVTEWGDTTVTGNVH